MELSWIKVLVFAGTSGVLSALVVYGLGLLDHWRKKGRDAGYLAIRIATALEAYADDCLTIIGEFDIYRQSGGAGGSQSTSLPNAPNFPEDTEGWRSLPTELVADVLSFPNHIRAGQDRISFDWANAGEMAAWDDCEDECARLGDRAWKLAVRLRTKYGFPAFTPPFDIGASLARIVNERDLAGN